MFSCRKFFLRYCSFVEICVLLLEHILALPSFIFVFASLALTIILTCEERPDVGQMGIIDRNWFRDSKNVPDLFTQAAPRDGANSTNTANVLFIPVHLSFIPTLGQ